MVSGCHCISISAMMRLTEKKLTEKTVFELRNFTSFYFYGKWMSLYFDMIYHEVFNRNTTKQRKLHLHLAF